MLKTTKKVLSGAVVATIAFSMIASTASAATLAEMQASLAALTAQIAAMSGGAPTTCHTFSTDLKLGSKGAEVKALQVALNENAATQVAATGVGSKGMETETFGPMTQTAVKKFQTLKGLTPVAGYFGPKSQAAMNASCVSTPTTPTTPVVTPATGPVSVALAATSPKEGGLIGLQAGAKMADFEFKGVGTVTSVTLTRSGYSNKDALTAVYLYDGETRLTDGYTFNTATMVINGLNIAVNGSKVITVKADIVASPTATQTNIALALTSFTSAGVVNAVNVQGGTMSFVTATLAGVVLGTNTAAAASINAGTPNYTIWNNDLTISTRSVNLTGATFRMVGSAPTSALSDISLIVDGAKVGSFGTIDTLNNIVFDVSAAPVNLAVGSHTVEIRANVVGGSERSFYITMQKAGDIKLIDSTYGVSASISAASFVSAGYKAGTITIGVGTISLTKNTAFDTSAGLVSGATNVAIGKYKLQAYGENVKITQMAVTVNNSLDTGLQNVGLYVDGVQVGSSHTYAALSSTTAYTFELGSSLTVPAGTTALLEVKADMSNAAGTVLGASTLITDINIPTDGAQGMSSYTMTSAGTPGTTSMTVASATAELYKSLAFANQTAAITTAVKVGSYTIKAGSTEGIRVTNLNVAFSASTGTATTSGVEATDIGNLKITTDGGLTFSTPVAPSLTSNNFSVALDIAAGQKKTIDVYVDVTAATADETITTSMYATARGLASNIAIASAGFTSVTGVTGQAMTVGTGTLSALTVVTSSDTYAQYVGNAAPTTDGDAVGATGRKLVRYNLVATGGAITLSELVFDVVGTTQGALISLTATGNKGGSACTAEAGASTVTMTGCDIKVPKGLGGTDLVVTASYGAVGTNGVASSSVVVAAIHSVKYTDGITTTTTHIDGATTPYLAAVASSSQMSLVASMPAVTFTSGGQILQNGLVKLGVVTVTAGPGGSVKLISLPITATITGGATFATTTTANEVLFVKEGTADITATDGNSATIPTTLAGASTGLITFGETVIVTPGTPRAFDIYGYFASVTGDNDTAQVSLTPTANFVWDDVSGGGTSLTGTLLPGGYPTTPLNLSYH
jgi:hypothetical protein